MIVGGGFAGLYAALQLDRRLGYHRDLKITVIDRRNYFLFPPLLPSVATGSIETRQVTYPFRRIFEATNICFKKETVDRIDVEARTIHARVDVDDDPATCAPQVIYCDTPYDYLILAPGSDTNTFNTPGAAEHAFFMRELGDAIAREYQRCTVILWTQLVAHVLYRQLVAQTPELDLFGRQRVREATMPRAQLEAEVGEARDRLLAFAAQGRVHVGPVLQTQSPEKIVEEALTAWDGYHTRAVATVKGRDIVIEDPNLLLFYQNRLVPFAEDLATPDSVAAARTIAALGGRA